MIFAAFALFGRRNIDSHPHVYEISSVVGLAGIMSAADLDGSECAD